ncbi:MAG: nitroreductase family protein, partial [Pyrinomonadaceae bacterium]
MNQKFPDPKLVPLKFQSLSIEEQMRRAEDFREMLNGRRTVRDFSSDPVPFELIEKAILTAGTAPSGANMQPWRFVVVKDREIKRKIRIAAEEEEYKSYHGRMSEKWLRRLAILGTDEHKPFLEIAPYLIVVFRIDLIRDEETGETEPTYYSQESVGIAVG